MTPKKQVCPAKPGQSGGFTLLEILLVVGIISILAGIVIIAINPSKQLATVRNTERKSDLKTLYNAMQQYYIDYGSYPGSIPSSLTEICNTGAVGATTTSVTGDLCSDTGLVNLSDLVPTYLVAIPVDPQGSPVALLTNIAEAATIGTGYLVGKNANNKVTVSNLRTELNVTFTYGPELSQAYDVIFDANSGTGSMSNLTIASGTSQTLTANTFTRANYTFTGWNTAANGSGTAYANNASFTMHGGNVTLYAQWISNLTAPAAPTIGTATAGNATSSVTFTANGNGGSTILYYTITSNPGSITASGASSPITVTGLTNGTAYTFTVTASNVIGTSSPSSASNSVTPADPIVTGLRSGLVAYYPLDSDTNDYSGNGYNGTNYNGATLNVSGGQVGGDYQFDGSNDYLQTSQNISSLNSFTVAGWIKPGTLAHDKYVIDSMSNFHLATYNFGSGIKFYIQKVGGASEYATSTTTPSNGNWYYVVGTYNGSQISIYVNGVLEANSAATGSSNGNTPLYIGAYQAGKYFNGSIDEVSIWNRSLNSTEVSQLYNGGSGRSLKP